MRVQILAMMMLASPAIAGVEEGRDFMEAGDYASAMAEFLPAARSGNADAEELIGVLYARPASPPSTL